MYSEFGKKCPCKVYNTKILNNQSIRPNPVKILQESVHPFGFTFLHNRIDGYQHFFAASVHCLDSCLKLGPGEIRGTQPRVKTFQSEIHSIRAFCNSRIQGFGVSSRCKQFRHEYLQVSGKQNISEPISKVGCF